MTAQEKWVTTIQCIQLVQRNYRFLKEERTYRGMSPLQKKRIQALQKWVYVIELTYRKLRSRRDKSSARARRDWLIARVIELKIFENEKDERICRHLYGTHLLQQRYVNTLTEEAIKAIRQVAEEKGVFKENCS